MKKTTTKFEASNCEIVLNRAYLDAKKNPEEFVMNRLEKNIIMKLNCVTINNSMRRSQFEELLK